MKKSRKIIIVVLIILIVLIIFLIYKKNVENNDSDSSLLAVSSYSNYGFYDDFKGTAIFNNGSIYTWNMNKFRSSDTKYDLNSIDGLKKFVLNMFHKLFLFLLLYLYMLVNSFYCFLAKQTIFLYLLLFDY